MKILLSIFIIFLSATTGSYASDKQDTNGFDTACNIFKEASQKNLSPVDLGQYIEERLKSMPEQNAKQDVIELYDVLFQAEPSRRYSLFRESAEHILKRKWHCESIKQIYEMK